MNTEAHGMTELVLDLYDPLFKKTVTMRYNQKLNIRCIHGL